MGPVEDQFYGQERFHEALQQLRERPIAEVVDGVIDAIMDYGDRNPPRDDVTLLGLEFQGGVALRERDRYGSQARHVHY